MTNSINTWMFLAEAAPTATTPCGHKPSSVERRSADADALAGRHAR
jgi:hypothetical protein